MAVTVMNSKNFLCKLGYLCTIQQEMLFIDFVQQYLHIVDSGLRLWNMYFFPAEGREAASKTSEITGTKETTSRKCCSEDWAD